MNPITALTHANDVARAERAALCDLFDEVGPDAPTLCGGWTTRDLAAHLVVRERRPDAAGGLVVPALRGRLASVQLNVATRPWSDLVAAVRSGPPMWNPMRYGPLDSQGNTIEFFVHHEDVRRASDGWTPRALPAATVVALTQQLSGVGRFVARRSSVGIACVPEDGPEAGRTQRLRSGVPDVTLVGPVGEIVLALYGRTTQGLDIVGDAAAVEAFLSFPR